jgi:hypothetical protein
MSETLAAELRAEQRARGVPPWKPSLNAGITPGEWQVEIFNAGQQDEHYQITACCGDLISELAVIADPHGFAPGVALRNAQMMAAAGKLYAAALQAQRVLRALALVAEADPASCLHRTLRQLEEALDAATINP